MVAFRHDLGKREWLAVSVYCILTSLSLLTVHEGLVRFAGHKVSMVDDSDLWAMQRGRLEKLQQNSVVLLGASRMQTNIDLAVLEKEMGCEVIQLAQSGLGTSYPVFVDIVKNTEYKGLVVCDENEFTLPSEDNRQFASVRHFKKSWTLDRFLNKQAECALQSNFVLLNPNSSSFRLWGNLLIEGELPEPFHVSTAMSRQQFSDFADSAVRDRVRALTEERAGYFEGLGTKGYGSSVQWRAEVLATWGPLISEFRARGGRFIFVRFPTSPKKNRAEMLKFPYQDYWLELMRQLDVPFVHFVEHPGLAEFSFPDESHLDYRDAPAFTIKLVGILKEILSDGTTGPSLGASG